MMLNLETVLDGRPLSTRHSITVQKVRTTIGAWGLLNPAPAIQQKEGGFCSHCPLPVTEHKWLKLLKFK